MIYHKGDLKQADAILSAAVDGLRRLGRPATAELVNALQWLGQVLRDEDKRQQAVTVQLESLDLARRANGEDHPSTLSALDALGLLYWDLGRLNEAPSALAVRRYAEMSTKYAYIPTLQIIEGMMKAGFH